MNERNEGLTARDIRQTQVDPVAGIWYCNNCGRRIQVVQDGFKPKVHGFICVCDHPMEPGEEHSHLEPDRGSAVDD